MKLLDGAVERQTTDQPVAPLFLCDADGNWIELEELVATERTLFRLSSRKEYEFIAYAADETKWRMQYECPTFSIWTRLIQYIRTSKIVVPVRWDRCGKYHLDELRAAFLRAVQHDDDVLTQFVERDELVSCLKAAASFNELVRIWEWSGRDS